jgi:hypothetical protein
MSKIAPPFPRRNGAALARHYLAALLLAAAVTFLALGEALR